jgi:hypothetical protein
LTLAELIATLGPTAPILPRGSRLTKLVLCNTPSCEAARIAGVAAGDRRANVGKNYVPSELTGVATCADCGTQWPVGPVGR